MIKAIETVYKGYRFRSRLEARWAVFFDSAGIKWQYEHEGFQLSSGERYLPDFYLPELDVFAEVKGGGYDDTSKRFYLAGKMDRWRDPILDQYYCTNPYIPGLREAMFHACDTEETVVEHSMQAICNADWVFAYISTLDCFGTIAEIGYAAGINKPTYVAVDASCLSIFDTGGHGVYLAGSSQEWVEDESMLAGHTCVDSAGNEECHTHSSSQSFLEAKARLGECWFPATMATHSRVVDGSMYAVAWFNQIFHHFKIRDDEQKAKTLSRDSGKKVVILRDIPSVKQSFRCFTPGNYSGSRYTFLRASDFDFSQARSARFEFNR